MDTLLYELDDAGIALVTINRPDKLNALNAAVMEDLGTCFAQMRDDDDVKGVILTGAGEKSFVAGADIRQFTQMTPTDGHRFALRGQAIFTAIEAMPKPVVAAVNGFALGGGCELALACHLRTASDNARFGQPEVNLGIIPGYGGTQRLPRLVGLGVAREMIMTGNPIAAQRAYEIGLVNGVFAQDELIDGTRKLVGTIIEKGPVAVQLSLEALRASDLPLGEGLRHEAALFGQACATDDFKEGATAFLDRRKPTFKGR